VVPSRENFATLKTKCSYEEKYEACSGSEENLLASLGKCCSLIRKLFSFITKMFDVEEKFVPT